jgi:hypothetical protein
MKRNVKVALIVGVVFTGIVIALFSWWWFGPSPARVPGPGFAQGIHIESCDGNEVIVVPTGFMLEEGEEYEIFYWNNSSRTGKILRIEEDSDAMGDRTRAGIINGPLDSYNEYYIERNGAKSFFECIS